MPAYGGAARQETSHLAKASRRRDGIIIYLRAVTRARNKRTPKRRADMEQQVHGTVRRGTRFLIILSTTTTSHAIAALDARHETAEDTPVLAMLIRLEPGGAKLAMCDAPGSSLGTPPSFFFVAPPFLAPFLYLRIMIIEHTFFSP